MTTRIFRVLFAVAAAAAAAGVVVVVVAVAVAVAFAASRRELPQALPLNSWCGRDP